MRKPGTDEPFQVFRGMEIGERPVCRRFSSIGSDQSDFFPGIQPKRSIYEEQLLAILLIDVRERDHFEGATRGTLPLPV
jgi:hypothetical protein